MFQAIMKFFSISLLAAALMLGVTSCDWSHGDASRDEAQRERDQRTRDDMARATEKLKPEMEEAGRKLGQAAHEASEQARAAAQGIHDGWTQASRTPLDVNSATQSELMRLPGITRQDAARIIRGRPYHDNHDLLSKDILSDSSYARIKDDITAQ
jgi:DNA uptake protein ComE-like DNA-binding protein